MDRSDVIKRIEGHVRAALEGNDASHDWAHIERVRALALRIAADEQLSDAQRFAVELGALLHDISDWKYAEPGADSHALACAEVEALLPPLGVDAPTVARVCEIISRIGFKDELPSAGGGAPKAELSLEARVVQDADRLDAIGAIGIARCFTFGGRFGRPLYDASQPPRAPGALTREAYMGAHAAADGGAPSPTPSSAAAASTENGSSKIAGAASAAKPAANPTAKSVGPATVNHFHEKLLRLKGMMKTRSGRALAEGRHAFMERFLEQLGSEIKGDA